MTEQLRNDDSPDLRRESSELIPQSRFGIYFTPNPASPVARIWNNWLNNSGELKDLTTQPRIYGFHATLKPPFRLKPEFEYADLQTAVRQLALDFETLPLPPMEVEWLGSFLALNPIGNYDAITRIADSCVRSLDGLRAPMSELERSKRLRNPLGGRELALLERWGYPYVLDQYRFHFTLSNSMGHSDQPRREKLFRSALWLHEQTAHVWPELDALSIVEQVRPDARFVVRERVLLPIHQAHQ